MRPLCVDADLLTSTILYQAFIDVDALCAIDQVITLRTRAMIRANVIVARVHAITIRDFFELRALVDVSATDIVINQLVPSDASTAKFASMKMAHLRATTIRAILTGIGFDRVANVRVREIIPEPVRVNSVLNVLQRWWRGS